MLGLRVNHFLGSILSLLYSVKLVSSRIYVSSVSFALSYPNTARTLHLQPQRIQMAPDA